MKMNYYYTAYFNKDEDRIKAIEEDILREYPNLGVLAVEAAKLEKPFGRVHEDYELFSDQENQINRLIDIVIVTEGKTEYQAEYQKACEDLIKSYQSWLSNFSYANPEEQSVYLVMQKFYEHQRNKEVPLMTVNQASMVLLQMQKEKDRKMIANFLREKIPGLGSIADEVIRLEQERGHWIRFQENDLIRLVTIIKLTEGKKEYEAAFNEAMKLLGETYSNWLKNETRDMSQEQKIVMEMVEQLKDHFEHPTNNIPIVTYDEMAENFKGKANTH